MYRIIDVIYPICLSVYLQYLQGCVSFKIRTSPPKFMTFLPRLNKKKMRSELWVFSLNLHNLSSCSPSTNNRTNSSTHKLSRDASGLNESPLHPTKSNPPFGRSKNHLPTDFYNLQPFTTTKHVHEEFPIPVVPANEVNSYRRPRRNWRNPISQSFEP